MADVFDQLEAREKRDERERDLLLAFVQQIAAGQFTKGHAVIRAKSLLREVSPRGVRVDAMSQTLTVAELAKRSGVKSLTVMERIKEWGGGDVTLNQPINLIGLATAALAHGMEGEDRLRQERPDLYGVSVPDDQTKR